MELQPRKLALNSPMTESNFIKVCDFPSQHSAMASMVKHKSQALLLSSRSKFFSQSKLNNGYNTKENFLSESESKVVQGLRNKISSLLQDNEQISEQNQILQVYISNYTEQQTEILKELQNKLNEMMRYNATLLKDKNVQVSVLAQQKEELKKLDELKELLDNAFFTIEQQNIRYFDLEQQVKSQDPLNSNSTPELEVQEQRQQSQQNQQLTQDNCLLNQEYIMLEQRFMEEQKSWMDQLCQINEENKSLKEENNLLKEDNKNCQDCLDASIRECNTFKDTIAQLEQEFVSLKNEQEYLKQNAQNQYHQLPNQLVFDSQNCYHQVTEPTNEHAFMSQPNQYPQRQYTTQYPTNYTHPQLMQIRRVIQYEEPQMVAQPRH